MICRAILGIRLGQTTYLVRSWHDRLVHNARIRCSVLNHIVMREGIWPRVIES